MYKWVTPFNITEYLRAGMSNQPHLLGLPVVEPNSLPLWAIVSPTSSKSSVGKGPAPTLVQYALKIPYTLEIFLGEIPRPIQAPAVVVFEDVTKG